MRIPRLLPLMAAAWLAGCASDATAPDPTPRPLEVQPTRGAPGSLVEIQGLDTAGFSEEELLLTIGGESTPVRVAPRGGLIASVPLFLAPGTSQSTPPVDPVDIRLERNGKEVGGADAVFQVTLLPEAPGAVTEVSVALAEIVANLKGLTLTLQPEPSEAQAVATVMLDAVADLLVAEGEESLAHQLSLLDAATDGSRELLEGLMSASGALAQLQEVATLSSELAITVEELVGPSSSRKVTEIDDLSLATRMQLYVVIRDFGSQVLGSTATTWGTTVGLAGGTAGLVVNVPIVGTVSAILGVASFAINNVAVAYLPAKIDAFELEVGQPFVYSGDVAETEIRITASNTPPSITILDLVDLVLTAMGFGASPDRETFRGILTNTANYFLDRVRQLMSAYATANPGTVPGADFASIPNWTWTTTVTDIRFVEPKSHTPELIDANGLGILKWRAKIDADGDGRIYAEIKSGPETNVLPPIPGYEFNIGAFGEAILATATQDVVVGQPLEVTASMASEISEGGTNGLEIRAGTRNGIGDVTWQEGYSVTLTVTGGSADPTQGLTGPDGRFNTLVTLDEGSDEVQIEALATAPNGLEGQASASATAGGDYLEIEADFVREMESGQTETLEIYVERRNATGGDDEPFANVVLQVSGGSASQSSGLTNDGGEFETALTMGEAADELEVIVRVTTQDGLEAETTVRALNLDQLPIRLIAHGNRAWLNAVTTNGPIRRLYRDNGAHVTGRTFNVDWTQSSSGEKEGKTVDMTSSLQFNSNVIVDAAGNLKRLESTSVMSGVGSISARETGGPVGTVETQVSQTLIFRINEGSWRMSWEGTQHGESRDAHASWESYSFFKDLNGLSVESPPDSLIQGEMVLGPGEYTFSINPNMRGGLGANSELPTLTSTGGHTLIVDFEPVASAR